MDVSSHKSILTANIDDAYLSKIWHHLAVVFIVVLVVYGVTASHSVGLEDDGLFILSSHFGGVAHPPGYPLFSLFGHLFDQIPFGSTAYKVHLTSGFFGAAACAVIWWCVYLLIQNKFAAYVTAISFGFSSTFWSQAIVAEVYTLNALFFFLILTLCLRFLMCKSSDKISATSCRRQLALISFLYGLSLANHWPLMVLASPAYVILLTSKWKLLLKYSPALLLTFLLGLIPPYAWMIFRSQADPLISFSGPIQSLSEAWFVLSRQGYKSVDSSMTADIADKFLFAGFFLRRLLFELSPAGFILAGVGFARQTDYFGGRVAASLIAAFLCSSLLLIILLGFDYDAKHVAIFRVYPFVSYGVLAIWLGLGLHVVSDFLATKVKSDAVVRSVGLLLGVFVLAGSFFWGLIDNYRRGFDYAEQYANFVLESMPLGAIVFANEDVAFGSIAYQNLIENIRPDITLYQIDGLVLSNRLVHPMRATVSQKVNALENFIGSTNRPVYTLGSNLPDTGHENLGFYSKFFEDLAKPAEADFNEDLFDKYQMLMASEYPDHPWLQLHRGWLSFEFGWVIGYSMADHQNLLEQASNRYPALFEENLEGSFGVALGMIARNDSVDTNVLLILLKKIKSFMDGRASDRELGLYYYLSGVWLITQGNIEVALQHLEQSVEIWPSFRNGAIDQLFSLYSELGREDELVELQKIMKELD